MPRRTFVKLLPYLQVIIDNNLFRPLGYRKAEWTLKLELIGTMVYSEGMLLPGDIDAYDEDDLQANEYLDEISL